MSDILWKRYPRVHAESWARKWLQIEANLQHAPKTVDAYGRDLEDFLHFCERHEFPIETATREHISLYVRDLATRPHPRATHSQPTHGLANRTMVRRLVTVRLFFDFLVEEDVRERSPVARGHYTPGHLFGGHRDRGLLRRYEKLPWIPSPEQWDRLVQAAQAEPLRNRLMFALAYDGALRCEELCTLETRDLIDPVQRLIRIRAEATKGRRDRTVRYRPTTRPLLNDYLRQRRHLNASSGRLFLSESRRNLGQALSTAAWDKVVRRLREHARVPEFTTHTFRHLRLTDLARAGLELHDIAAYAGHKSAQTALTYLHLSGCDVTEKVRDALESLTVRWMGETKP